VRHNHIDATAAALVREPCEFDVLVTENMFGPRRAPMRSSAAP